MRRVFPYRVHSTLCSGHLGGRQDEGQEGNRYEAAVGGGTLELIFGRRVVALPESLKSPPVGPAVHGLTLMAPRDGTSVEGRSLLVSSCQLRS